MEAKKVTYNIKLNPLKSLLTNTDIAKLEKALLSFVCEKDDAVQNFLRYEAIQSEKEGKARTYLFINNKNDDILGYFTITINSIIFGKNISSEVKKLLNYDENKKHFKYMKPYVPAYLLALFGKDDIKYQAYQDNREKQLKNKYGTAYKKHIEKFADIALPAILTIVKQANNIAGGQVLYLDCERKAKLIKFYERFAFTYFRDNEDDNTLMQLIQKIC